MPRRFKLGRHRKYDYRSRANRCLSVSIPLRVPHIPGLCAMQRWIVSLSLLPSGWFDVSPANHFCLIYSKIETKSDALVLQVTYALEISESFVWTVRVQGREVEVGCTPLAVFLSSVFSVSLFGEIIKCIDSCHICIGNNDSKFYPLQASRKGVFMDSTGSKETARYVKDYFSSYTIRSIGCSVLVREQNMRCSSCKDHRSILSAMLSRYNHATSHSQSGGSITTSHTNYRYLNTPEAKERLSCLHSRARVTAQQTRRLERRLEIAIESRGIEVDASLHEDLCATISENSTLIKEQSPPGSFSRIFWEQQAKAMTLKNSKSMRWEPAMIRWCIYLRHLSSSSYELLRTCGVLKLPSQRTLRDYTYYTNACTGFSASVDKQLVDMLNINTCAEREKYVIIIMDEMHIREDIVYDKHSGAVLGYADLGDLNNHLRKYEKTVVEDEASEEVAKSMMVIMVRGLFTKFQFAYAQFPCAALRGHHMYDIFWESVRRLERCGLKVLGCTCDGLSANRTFFKSHDKNFTYKVKNPYAEDGRDMLCMSDTAHLMKTVRNGWYSNKRLLWFDGKYIEWKHLEDLYHKCQPSVASPGLTILPKLKYEHISLTSFSKMRVDLAVQVLSNSVGEAMKLMNDSDCEKTIEFVQMFDKFFDCVNVSSLEKGKHGRNPFKAPYYSAEDFRIKWLEDTFLPYLDKWEKSVQTRPGFEKQKAEQSKMLLSEQTRFGLRMTVKSFVELVKIALTVPGVKYFLSNKICQDPLENFFGQQRQRGRVNDNPNVQEFIKNTQALRVVNGLCSSIKGNCRGAAKRGPTEIENTPLEKRKRYNK